MMAITDQQAFDGKSAEHIVISELLKKGYVPFVPVLDRGIDIIVKSNKYDKYYELQVKSNNSPIVKNQEWFVFSKVLQVRKNLIYVLVDIVNNGIWLIPSDVVSQHGNQCKTQFDLHLKQVKKGESKTRGELLKTYKNKWDILK